MLPQDLVTWNLYCYIQVNCLTVSVSYTFESHPLSSWIFWQLAGWMCCGGYMDIDGQCWACCQYSFEWYADNNFLCQSQMNVQWHSSPFKICFSFSFLSIPSFPLILIFPDIAYFQLDFPRSGYLKIHSYCNFKVDCLIVSVYSSCVFTTVSCC